MKDYQADTVRSKDSVKLKFKDKTPKLDESLEADKNDETLVPMHEKKYAI